VNPNPDSVIEYALSMVKTANVIALFLHYCCIVVGIIVTITYLLTYLLLLPTSKAVAEAGCLRRLYTICLSLYRHNISKTDASVIVKCSAMSPGIPFILGSGWRRSRSPVVKAPRTLLVGSTCGPLAAVSCLYRDTAVRCSVVGPFLWPARRPGTRYQTTFEMRYALFTVFVVT